MRHKILRQTIIDELDFEPSIDGENIGVGVDNGVGPSLGTSRAMRRRLRSSAL